jgi:protein-tyrosine phosphatase
MLPYHSLPLAVIGVSGACFASAPLAYVLLYAGVQYAVAFVCAMATTGVGLLGKREDGAMPLWSYAVFWPLHAAKAVFKSQIKNRLTGKTSSNPPATEIIPGWWLGGRHADDLNVPWVTIVDCCNEFPRFVYGSPSTSATYLTCPSWDATACNAEEMHRAAQALVRAAATGPVLCPCASGKGRSVCVMMVALIIKGECDSLEEAQAAILAKRKVSAVLTNPLMSYHLRAWDNDWRHKKKA